MMQKSEAKRQATVRTKILNNLRQAGEKGMTNVQLSKIAVRYGGALGKLYELGYDIKKENHGDGVYNYILISEPEREITEHKSALDILTEGINKVGLVDSNELKWLLDELGLNVKRKANTYKKKNGALV